MSSMAASDVKALAEAAACIGARPFKDATGHWANSVEIALMDTILSASAVVDGAYGAGVLPRLRAYKAFRGPADMMRLLATMGPFALDDFVAEQHHKEQLMNAAAALMDAGVHAAADVDPQSTTQREALVSTEGVPELAWDYFLIMLNINTPLGAQLRNAWLDDFVARSLGDSKVDVAARDVLLAEVTGLLHAEHYRKSFGRMPEFTLPQLWQAIFRSEYARATS